MSAHGGGAVAELLETMLEVGTPAELAERYYPNGRLGGLCVAAPKPGALGQLVWLRVQVRRPPRVFRLKGQLAWARHKSGPGQPAGFGVDFLPDDDVTRVRLLAFAREELSGDVVRAELRYQVELKVRLLHEGRERRELVADLSVGGAFVRSWNPLPVGAPLQVFLRLPLSLTTTALKAHVAWVRLAGEHPGMGLEFEHDDATRERVRQVVARIAR